MTVQAGRLWVLALQHVFCSAERFLPGMCCSQRQTSLSLIPLLPCCVSASWPLCHICLSCACNLTCSTTKHTNPGEAAVASASEQQDLRQGSDSDKGLALGAKILSSMTPFVAAAAQRVPQEELFELTSRLHAVMLAAAGLAARQRDQTGVSATMTSAPSSFAGIDLQESPSLQQAAGVSDAGGKLHKRQSQQQQQHQSRGASWGSSAQHSAAGHEDVAGKLAARMRRLAARREAAHQRLMRKQSRQQSKKQQQHPRMPSVAQPNMFASRVHVTDLGTQHHAWSGAGASSSAGPRRSSLDGGMSLGGGLSRQQLLSDAQAPKVAEEDLLHPWSWDVTQPLTFLSAGIKVRVCVCVCV